MKQACLHRTVFFNLPQRTTINMNETAYMNGMAVMFIAQALWNWLKHERSAIDRDYSPSDINWNCRNSHMISVMLAAVKLPLEGIGLILTGSRTTVNVWGNTCAAMIIAKSEGEKNSIQQNKLQGSCQPSAD